jgi:hypothetical protein
MKIKFFIGLWKTLGNQRQLKKGGEFNYGQRENLTVADLLRLFKEKLKSFMENK